MNTYGNSLIFPNPSLLCSILDAWPRLKTSRE